jgi:DNA-binding PadR family transcriptional regulator
MMTKPPKALPAASLHIVLALLDGELHGYALMRRVGELSDGAVQMGPGTMYGTLNRLVAEGLIAETTDRVSRTEGERRRYYELTPNGRAVAVAELHRLQTVLQRVTGGLAGGATA